MKKFKKVFAVILSLAMVLGMSMTAFAANGKPESTDSADVTISSITKGAKVTLYQIASAKYGPGGKEITGYTWVEENLFTVETDPETKVKTVKPTAEEIVEVGYRLQGRTTVGDKTVAALSAPIAQDVNKISQQDIVVGDNGTYTAKVGAGVYIAIISNDNEVYNPILLSASYGSNGNITTDNVIATDGYLYGTTAVAKKTTPDVEKNVTGGVDDTDDQGNPIKTASVGDVLTYTVTPTMPSYPVNANNKTFYIADRMSAGLTFIADSIVIKIDNEEIKGVLTAGVYIFTNSDGEIIAKAKSESTDGINGFNLNFDYEKLQDKDTGSVSQPIVTYKAVINENAVVGKPGNNNEVDMFYAEDPSEGSTFDTDDVDKTPDGATGVVKKEDSKVVYTYQISFFKTKDDNTTGLEGAVFGVYDEKGKLVDQVTTNNKGYAVSTNVSKGTYTVKELVAPEGYSLNTNEYEIEASWATATYTVSETVTDRTYTTERPSDDAEQIGWIADGVFYKNETDVPAGVKKKPAYLSSENTTTVEENGIVENGDIGNGTALMDGNIPNTQLASLPSTGGIGTTIFTIGGCAIMIIAAALFFASRRKSAK